MRFRRIAVRVLVAYSVFSIAVGIFLCKSALHPSRRPLTTADKSRALALATSRRATLKEVSIQTADHLILRAWLLTPAGATRAVMLLHGLSDNRMGMIEYADQLLAHNYAVFLPDARAHGASDGVLATYGLLEREDIRQWAEWLAATEHPACIDALGESMGAAQLLQSLAVEPHFCAVAAESSFSNFHEIAYDRIGQCFRTGPWLGRTLFRPAIEIAFVYARRKYHLDLSHVSPETVISQTRVPILLIHGADDSNIPVRHSERLAAVISNTVFWKVPHADHCGAISAAPADFQTRLLTWYEVHSPPWNRSR